MSFGPRRSSFLPVSFAVAVCVSTSIAAAQVSFDPATKVFRLDGGQVTYAFGINERGELQSIYWGGKLGAGDAIPAAHTRRDVASFDSTYTNTPQEFSGWGAGIYVEPALKIAFPDGNRDLELRYVSHSTQDDTLKVVLRDVERNVLVTLSYSIDPSTGILAKSAVIQNETQAPLTVVQCAAGDLSLPSASRYRLHSLAGHWAGEFSVQDLPITRDKIVIESRRGSTGHQNNPWFAADNDPSTDEQHGDVWFGALAWSGSWRMTFEQDALDQVRITAGYNSFDFSYVLQPKESLSTPVLYAGFTPSGMGEASRLMHRFERTKILPERPNPRPRPVLYNSWEATGFDVNEAGQIALAEKAASIGVERFVMDDGWFGQRKDDHAGLGDWYVNQQKFPNGLKPLIDRVHQLGMDFGLWVEPEMVNPDSDLYRKHPDWVLNFTGRPRTEARNQLVLNLARADVRDYIFHALDTLLTQNDIAFLKWDYNRNWSEPGWPAVAPEQQQAVYVKYVQNLYSILRELREKHPNVEIESCSGGGGRVDLGILALTDEVWTSDNTDPFDRLTIQDGFTRAYTPGVMMAWVTDSPNFVNHRVTSLEYRFFSSMQGSLGVGANLNHWTAGDFATAKDLIAGYKEIRNTVQHGSLYRLFSPRGGSEFSATESVSEDKNQAVIFAFLHSSTELEPMPAVRLQGLAPDKQYVLRALGDSRTGDVPKAASGQYWMNTGIEPALRGDFQAAAFVLTAQGQ